MRPEKRRYNLHLTSSLFSYTDDENHGLGWRERYRIIKGICEGLKHLHTGFKTSFVHLGLNPDNILLDKNMVPKLADFPLFHLTELSRGYPCGRIGSP
jgi:coatomer subunit beta'